MRISNEALAILREKLPKGSVRIIRARLKMKNIIFSQQYIYRCLDPTKRAYKSVIIDEAILFCEELEKSMEQREERVFLLKKAG